MARIKGKDLFLKNDDQIYFGTNQEAALWYDNNGELRLNHTISGVDPTESYHLTTRWYVDDVISGTNTFLNLSDTPSTYSGSGNYIVTVKPDATGLQFTAPGSTVFGENFHYEEDAGPYETTGTTLISTASMTTSVVPAGTYRVSANYTWYHGANNQPFHCDLRFDTVTLKEQVQTSNSTSLLEANPDTLVGYVTTTSETTHTIDIQIASGSTGKTAGIEQITIEFWRVS